MVSGLCDLTSSLPTPPLSENSEKPGHPTLNDMPQKAWEQAVQKMDWGGDSFPTSADSTWSSVQGESTDPASSTIILPVIAFVSSSQALLHSLGLSPLPSSHWLSRGVM